MGDNGNSDRLFCGGGRLPNLHFLMASLVAQRLQRLPAMQETRVRPLGWEDPLEKETATHSSTLAWRIPWREEPGGLWGCKESDTTEQLWLNIIHKYLEWS